MVGKECVGQGLLRTAAKHKDHRKKETEMTPTNDSCFCLEVIRPISPDSRNDKCCLLMCLWDTDRAIVIKMKSEHYKGEEIKWRENNKDYKGKRKDHGAQRSSEENTRGMTVDNYIGIRRIKKEQ